MRATLGLVAALSLMAAPQACAPAERISDGESVGRARAAVGFSPTGAMTQARGRHGAARLADGRILVVGGGNDQVVEIYDPASGTFAAVPGAVFPNDYYLGMSCASCPPQGVTLLSGEPFWPTHYHGVIFDSGAGAFRATSGSFDPSYRFCLGRVPTLLQDGRVLFTGGIQDAKTARPSLTTAALFDPATETFALTGSMGERRLRHTATLLADGKVLIVGGENTHPVARHASAEVYDPATGAFSATGSMAQARSGHSAHRLPSGKVLVAGGVDAAGVLVPVAELYDVATGTFAATGSMVVSRLGFAATQLLDGRVLFTGGVDANDAVTATAEIYDPATGSFAPVPPMTTVRRHHTATTLLSGEVLLTGSWGRSASAELFDPTVPAADAGPLADAGTPDAAGLEAGAIDAGARDAAGVPPPKDAGSGRLDGDRGKDALADEVFVGGGGCGVGREAPLACAAPIVVVAALASLRLRRRARMPR